MSPETEVGSFPAGESALATTGWTETKEAEWRRGTLAFLQRCKARRAPATIMVAKEYLDQGMRQGPNAVRVQRRE